jgi:uncharacterized membrane protein
MKRTLITLGAAALLAVSVSAPVGAVSEHASSNACFGQARAGVATSAPGAVGAAASERKGDNARQNREFREACQALGDQP